MHTYTGARTRTPHERLSGGKILRADRTKGTRTHPDLAALLSDHLAMLHHVHRAQVDRVVCLVSQPVLIALTHREG